jgi:flagellar hook protein FlgE
MNTTANSIANVSKQGSGVDLSKEMTNQIVGEKVNAVNVSAIKAQDEMLGSLLDIKA